jgi:LmbE family N-acetylglucosaminyl deacetylase
MNQDYKDKVVLAIGAHPDDVEFGCGATMAYLHQQGATLYFAIATDGNRGSRQHAFEKSQLVESRKKEQLDAAKILGASEVLFLDEEDGNLVGDIQFKEKIVRLIRKLKPDMVFTHDPSWFYQIREDGSASVNHTDHRECGKAVLDAVYPLARDLQSFPDHIQEGMDAHIVPEVYLFNWDIPNFVFDVTTSIDAKIASIVAHKSQIDDPAAIEKRMRDRHANTGKIKGYQYGEGFTQLVFS